MVDSISDNELVSVPLNAEGPVVEIVVYKRNDEPFRNNPTISDVVIKACYEHIGKKHKLCMNCHTQSDMEFYDTFCGQKSF